MEIEREIPKYEHALSKKDHPMIVGYLAGLLIGNDLDKKELLELNEDGSWKDEPTDIVVMTISNEHETTIYDAKTLNSEPTNLE